MGSTPVVPSLMAVEQSVDPRGGFHSCLFPWDASYSHTAGAAGVSPSSLFSCSLCCIGPECFVWFCFLIFMTKSAFQPGLGPWPAFAKGISFSAAGREAPINGQVPLSSHSLRVGIVGVRAFCLSTSRSSKTPLWSPELFPRGL